MTSKGQLVLPAELRERDQVGPGQVFEVERLEAGDYRLRRLAAANEGLVGWLLSRPEGGLPDQLPDFGTTDGLKPDIE